MNSSHKWKKSKCSGDQVVPDIDFESKLDKRKPFSKAFDDRLTARHTGSAPVNSSSPVNNDRNTTNNRSYHRNQFQSNGHHNDKNHNSIATLDEFWEERYSRILTHNIFNNNNMNHLNEAK